MPPTPEDPIFRRVQERDVEMPGVTDRAAGERTVRRLSRFSVGDGRLAERVRGRWIMAKEPGMQAANLPFVRAKFVTDLPGPGSLAPSPEAGPASAPERQPLQVVTGRRVPGQATASQGVTGQGRQGGESNLSGTASPSVMRDDTTSQDVGGMGGAVTGEANSSQLGGQTTDTAIQAPGVGHADAPDDGVQRVSADQPSSREYGEAAAADLQFVRTAPAAADPSTSAASAGVPAPTTGAAPASHPEAEAMSAVAIHAGRGGDRPRASRCMRCRSYVGNGGRWAREGNSRRRAEQQASRRRRQPAQVRCNAQQGPVLQPRGSRA